MPREMRAIAYFTAEYARQYAPDRIVPLVGGFVMLRIFNPSLLTPEAYGLLPNGLVPGPAARRNLTLITKLLQNLSNNVEFGSKEQFMVPMNVFIERNRDRMTQYLTELARDPLTDDAAAAYRDCKSPPDKAIDATELRLPDVQSMHQYFHQHADKLRDKIATSPSANEFKRLLQALGAPSTKQAPKKAAAQQAVLRRSSDGNNSGGGGGDESSGVVGVVLKAGELVRVDHAVRHGQFYFVLTPQLLYYFRARTDATPHRAVPLDDVAVVDLADEGASASFTLTTTGKSHKLTAENGAATRAWADAINDAVRKYSARHAKLVPHRHRSRGAVRHQGRRGARHAADAAHDGDERGPTRRLVRPARGRRGAAAAAVVRVRVLGVWRALDRQAQLQRDYRPAGALGKLFPRLALPTLPRIADGDAMSELINKGKKITGAASETTQQLNIAISDANEPNEDLVYLIKFVRATLDELRTSELTGQSDPLFAFWDISSPLRAAESGNLSQLQFLVDNAANFNVRSDTGRAPMHIAVLKQRRDAVEFLALEAKADVNIADSGGNSPLHLAIYRNNPDIVALLLAVGARINAFNVLEQSPLMAACEGGHESSVVRLLARGAKVNAADSRGQTPLHLAIKAGSSTIAKLLLEHGADASPADKNGMTPLALATEHKLLDIAAQLVESGACAPNVADSKGRTAVHMAASRGQTRVLELLGQAKAAGGQFWCARRRRQHAAAPRGRRRPRGVARRAVSLVWRRPRRRQQCRPHAAAPGGEAQRRLDRAQAGVGGRLARRRGARRPHAAARRRARRRHRRRDGAVPFDSRRRHSGARRQEAHAAALRRVPRLRRDHQGAGGGVRRDDRDARRAGQHAADAGVLGEARRRRAPARVARRQRGRRPTSPRARLCCTFAPAAAASSCSPSCSPSRTPTSTRRASRTASRRCTLRARSSRRRRCARCSRPRPTSTRRTRARTRRCTSPCRSSSCASRCCSPPTAPSC
jgi:ankyrin repeat protein